MKEALAVEHPNPDEIPDFYVTMGPRTIMRAKNLIIIVSGKKKAKMVKRVLTGEVDENIPATILPSHPNITFILDKDAASELDSDNFQKVTERTAGENK